MGTRAATFTAKIRNLNDYYQRTVNNIVPLPSGIDIANTLKYFQQNLLSVLKDVPSVTSGSYSSRQRDSVRLSMFPNLNYKGLYHAVINVIDTVPLLQFGQYSLGQEIIQTLACLVQFLESDLIDALPYTAASMLATFPSTLHKEITDLLCNILLPLTLGESQENNEPSYAKLSTSAVIMMVLQYTDNAAYHSQLMECLMALKKDVAKDILCVIAYGSSQPRGPAINLLFHYWPALYCSLVDRKAVQYKFVAWKPITCQRDSCMNTDKTEAVKTCIDPACSIELGERPPPLFLCQVCCDEVRQQHPEYLADILLPMEYVSLKCENKNCMSSDRTGFSTCFSFECASYNRNRPIRYCKTCHDNRHNEHQGGDHIFHAILPSIWECDNELRGYLVEAIVSLMKEAQVEVKHRLDLLATSEQEKHRQSMQVDGEEAGEGEKVEERRLLSRYGIWLIVQLCQPNASIPLETIGRLLAVIFQWYEATACLPDDMVGAALESLKTEYIYKWLSVVRKNYFDVFVSCLLPEPPEYARVGGHWDTLSTATEKIKEGLNRLFCLIPYDVISFEVWYYIMPYWLEGLQTFIPKDELSELKVLLCKTFDLDLCPLPFSVDKMYKFVSVRFQNTPAIIQEQALEWLQLLSSLEIYLPMEQIIKVFQTGISSTMDTNVENNPEATKLMIKICVEEDEYDGQGVNTVAGPDFSNSAERNLPCFILMLDIILKQIEVQEMPLHQGMDSPFSKEVMMALKLMIEAPWQGQHRCSNIEETNDCMLCYAFGIFYQLALQVLECICPVGQIKLAKTADLRAEDAWEEDEEEEEEQKPEPTQSQSEAVHLLTEQEMKPGEPHEAIEMSPIGPKIMMATECEEGGIEMDVVAAMPQEHVVSAIARAVTLTDTDVGLATAKVATATLVDENEQLLQKPEEDDANFWHTSQGKFKFTLDELPSQLQLIYVLLKDLAEQSDPDVIYNSLKCLKLLFLHAECLNLAAKEHRGFLIWSQENLLIPNFWKLLQAKYSQLPHVCVPLILHCITLPSGADVFWKLVEDDFANDDMRARFAAVEKVTVLARFLDPQPVKDNQILQSALSTAFCHLVAAMEDVNPAVAQKAIHDIDTIKESSVLCLVNCLEQQFDSVIADRPVIILHLFKLFRRLKTMPILSWEFFYNRFDALCLEAQIDLENSGEIAYPTDLKGSSQDNDAFLKKLNKARFAVARSTSVRSMASSSNFGRKSLYQRTVSAPGAMLFAHSRQAKDLNAFYARQVSAPLPRRKSSRFGSSYIQQMTGGHLREFTDDESNFAAMLHKAMDLNGVDRETVHFIVTLLCKFMAEPNYVLGTDVKKTGKLQNLVLRHLNVLLGYNQNEKMFAVPPYKLRCSTVFNAFLSGLPAILDCNMKLGQTILPISLLILAYAPSPQRYASDYQPPNYTLWYLEPHQRQVWLMSLIIILYKYRYDQAPINEQVSTLVQLVINTLVAQHHVCRQLQDTGDDTLPGTPSFPRSRGKSDVSNLSIGDLENIQEGDTPPQTPTSEKADPNAGGPGSQWDRNRENYDDVEEDVEELESLTMKPIAIAPRVTEVKTLETLERAKRTLEKEASLADDEEDLKVHCVTYDTAMRVECQMAEELKAFDESYEQGRDEQHDALHGFETSEPLQFIEPSHVQAQAVSVKPTVVSMDSQVGVSRPGFGIERAQLSEPVQARALFEEPAKVVVSSELAPKATTARMFGAMDPVGAFQVVQPTVMEPMGVSSSLVHPGAVTVSSGLNNVGAVRISPNYIGSQQVKMVEPADIPESGLVRATVVSPKVVDDSADRFQIMEPVKVGNGSVISPIKVDVLHSLDQQQSGCMNVMHPTILHSIGSAEDIRGGQSVSVQPTVMHSFGSTENLGHASAGPLQSMALHSFDSIEDMSQKRGVVMHSMQSMEDLSRSPRSGSPRMLQPVQAQAMELHSLDSMEDLTSRGKQRGAGKKRGGSESPTPPRTTVMHSMGSMENVSGKTVQLQPMVLHSLDSAENLAKPGMSTPRTTVLHSLDSMEDLSGQRKLESPRVLSMESVESLSEEPKAKKDSRPKSLFPQPSDKEDQKKGRLPQFRQKKRKAGLGGLDIQKTLPELKELSLDPSSAKPSRKGKRSDAFRDQHSTSTSSSKKLTSLSTSARFNEDTVIDRCVECGRMLEQYDEEIISYCIVVLETFVHREPGMASPLLPNMLQAVGKIASNHMYPWQVDSNWYIPGNCQSVAKQCLRTVLHQLSSHGVFLQLFQSNNDDDFFTMVCSALADFTELNQWAPLVSLLEALNVKNSRVADDRVMILLHNMAIYMECLPLEGGPWNQLLSLFDVFFRALPGMLPSDVSDMTDAFKIMACVLKIPGLAQQKNILEPFSKIVSFTIQNCPFKLQALMDLCLLCSRAFTKERDKLVLSRAATFELVQALKFKTVLPDENLILLVQFIVLDAGGTLSPTNVADELFGDAYDPHSLITTNSSECMKQNLTDCIEFIADLHTISKVKSNMKGGSSAALNEDTLGGLLKAGVAQYVALEFTRSNGRDFRAHGRYLPWLSHPPSAMQQGPKEFTDCIAHIRLLSWLLLGSLTHSAMTQAQGAIVCQPIPIDASTHIADHVLVILTGFAEQSKASVLHMSSLYNTFILCQLWTMYCEQLACMNAPSSEQHITASVTILDFWGRVTPGVLQLVSHSKVLAEMVNLHFLSLIEALQECNSTVLSKLFPMWAPVLHCYHAQLPGQMQMRLQNCQNYIPPIQTKDELSFNSTILLQWLRRLQFKMAQIEMQSSAATQFYTV